MLICTTTGPSRNSLYRPESEIAIPRMEDFTTLITNHQLLPSRSYFCNLPSYF